MSHKVMYIREPVLGTIRLSPLQEELLKTVEVQRLSFIHQLGTTFQSYPGAHCMRLAHALGVSHLAGRIAGHLSDRSTEEYNDITGATRNLVEAAGLLHDIGHTPWSHTLEPLYLELTGGDHMDLVADMITGRTTMPVRGAGKIPEILRKYSIDPEDVADLITGRYTKKEFAQQMIFGEVDADMLDYLQRDFHFTGVAFGHIEVDRIISIMAIKEGKLVFLEKGLNAIRDFLLARLQMYSSVYLHKKTRIVDKMLLSAARRSVIELKEIESFMFMTDDEILSFLEKESADPWVREMAWRVKYRQGLFTQVFRVDAVTTSESDNHFLNSLRNQNSTPEKVAELLIAEISKKAGIDSGYILVDLPIEAVKISEERFQKLDIRFLNERNQMIPLDEIDPPFAEYLMKARPNRNLLTVACAPEFKQQVKEACGEIFKNAVEPLFSQG
ncbi:MAG: HD domain-containing protein [Candidatus Sabulitectum sp.]|nr:HD domain-containing protein [Candidatus Sabulitectum sp.]